MKSLYNLITSVIERLSVQTIQSLIKKIRVEHVIEHTSCADEDG